MMDWLTHSDLWAAEHELAAAHRAFALVPCPFTRRLVDRAEQHRIALLSKPKGTTMAQQPDLIVVNHGSIHLVTPMTPVAREWVEENVEVEDWAWMGLGFGVEPRLVEQLLEGAVDAGLEVRA